MSVLPAIAGAVTGGLANSLFGGGEKTTDVNMWKNVPQWLKDYYKDQVAYSSGLQGEAHRLYREAQETPQTAAWDPAEQMGLIGAAGVGADLDEMRALLGDGNFSIGDLQDKWGDRYIEDVLGGTIDDIVREAERARLADDARMASIGGLTGSRAGVADALREELTREEIARTSANLRRQGLQFGLEGALQEAALRGQLAQGAGDLGLSQADMLATLGGRRRDWNQQRLNEPRSLLDWLNRATSPQVPSAQGNGTSTTSVNGGGFNNIVGGATLAQGLWDRYRGNAPNIGVPVRSGNVWDNAGYDMGQYGQNLSSR